MLQLFFCCSYLELFFMPQPYIMPQLLYHVRSIPQLFSFRSYFPFAGSCLFPAAWFRMMLPICFAFCVLTVAVSQPFFPAASFDVTCRSCFSFLAVAILNFFHPAASISCPQLFSFRSYFPFAGSCFFPQLGFGRCCPFASLSVFSP